MSFWKRTKLPNHSTRFSAMNLSNSTVSSDEGAKQNPEAVLQGQGTSQQTRPVRPRESMDPVDASGTTSRMQHAARHSFRTGASVPQQANRENGPVNTSPEAFRLQAIASMRNHTASHDMGFQSQEPVYGTDVFLTCHLAIMGAMCKTLNSPSSITSAPGSRGVSYSEVDQTAYASPPAAIYEEPDRRDSSEFRIPSRGHYSPNLRNYYEREEASKPLSQWEELQQLPPSRESIGLEFGSALPTNISKLSIYYIYDTDRTALGLLVDWSYDGQTSKIYKFLKNPNDAVTMLSITFQFGIEGWYAAAHSAICMHLPEQQPVADAFKLLNTVYEKSHDAEHPKNRAIGASLIRKMNPTEFVTLVADKTWMNPAMTKDLAAMMEGLRFSSG